LLTIVISYSADTYHKYTKIRSPSVSNFHPIM